MLLPRVGPIFRSRAGLTELGWKKPPRTIFVAKKDFNPHVLAATRDFLSQIHSAFPVELLMENNACHEIGLDFVHQATTRDLHDSVDLVVTLGGDGIILRAAAQFKDQSRGMPPFLGFSMGTLGFLPPFDYKDAMSTFRTVYEGRSLVTRRARLAVSLPTAPGAESQDCAQGTRSARLHAMNDVTIHRGDSPHLAHLDISVNGQHVTTAVADGVTVSTPTGSTAYSLSAGGSIVHPDVRCLLLTPICPQSLSFRPLIFPETSHISISVGAGARGPSQISVDGTSGGQLSEGGALSVGVDPEEDVWCVSHGSATDDWVRHLNGLLGFNTRFGPSR